MAFREVRIAFDKNKVVYDSALLTFKGVEDFDVYNCSVPFQYENRCHIFGRIERREKRGGSRVRLFVETGKDEFTLVPNQLTYLLEDPFVSRVSNQMLFGGTQVIKDVGEVTDCFCDFYRGTPQELSYFTTGPDRMKSIRAVQLSDGSIGLFSCHNMGHACLIGFATVNALHEITRDVIASAPPVNHKPFLDAWGGVNQPYLLSSGKVGCISHHGYLDKDEQGNTINVCCITSFVYEPSTNKCYDFKILGTKNCFPPCPAKTPGVADCAFASGIVMRKDGKCDLYSGLGDTHEGRITIDYPFEGHGKIVDDLAF
ncbi:hypothetical protein ABL78_3976 [Leptomonas seymouri]|uniref:Uncharacterized protein n=1 Tax=Leptomonas seymouri TaxID=5684 RepID=A0A0N1I720_LEPSE|nr:hypothetical protein ABL78_3976 [Leptomonas seymouri]|eukprot:KPI86930.1 hypothetical protein ABL78_3976 [Leptomonas seymouri]